MEVLNGERKGIECFIEKIKMQLGVLIEERKLLKIELD